MCIVVVFRWCSMSCYANGLIPYIHVLSIYKDFFESECLKKSIVRRKYLFE